MRFPRRHALIAASTLLVPAWPAAAQLQLPPPQGYVDDFAHVIDAAHADSMKAVIDDVRRKSGGEIVVVTLSSLEGHPANEVALQIGREWKVGQKGDPTDRNRGTGVVVLLGMREHAWRIETGTGTETFIPGAEAGRIGRAMVPELHAGNVGRALLAGVDSLGEAYARHFGFQLAPSYAAPSGAAQAPQTGGEPALDADPAAAPERHSFSAGGLALALGGALLFLLIVFGVYRMVGGSGDGLNHWRRDRRHRGGRFYRGGWGDDDPAPYRDRGVSSGWDGVGAAMLLGELLDDDRDENRGSTGWGNDLSGDGGGGDRTTTIATSAGSAAAATSAAEAPMAPGEPMIRRVHPRVGPRVRAALTVAALALVPRVAAAQLQLPAPVGYVNDFAHVIEPAYADSMEAVIDDVRQKSGGEIVVVTLPSLEGRPAGEVALQIGREWKIGQKGGPTDRNRNSGVVVLLGMQEHDWRIETGTGTMTFISAAEAGRIGRELMVPELRNGNVGRALFLAVDTLGQRFAAQYGFQLTPSYPQTTYAPADREVPPDVQDRRVGSGGGSGFVVFVIFFVLLVVLSRFSGQRGCGGCLPLLLFSGGGRGGGWGGGGFGGGGFGGGGGGGFGGFGGGGGFSGGGAGGSW